jgi:hypothetical protein
MGAMPALVVGMFNFQNIVMLKTAHNNRETDIITVNVPLLRRSSAGLQHRHCLFQGTDRRLVVAHTNILPRQMLIDDCSVAFSHKLRGISTDGNFVDERDDHLSLVV